MGFKVGLLALALVGLCACSSNSNNSTDNTTPVGGNPGMKDVTPRNTCVGAAQPGISLFSTWHMYMTNGQLNLAMSASISNTTTTFTNTCYYPDGYALPASVTVPTSTNGNQFTILQGDQNSASQQVGDNKYSCSVSVRASTSTYQFMGNCLVLTMPGQQPSYMVP